MRRTQSSIVVTTDCAAAVIVFAALRDLLNRLEVLPRFRHGLFAINSARLHRGFGDRPPPATAKTSGFLKNAVTPQGADIHGRQLLTNEGSAPSSTSQFDLVINNMGRLRGRQR
jgi:hypothetical protein